MENKKVLLNDEKRPLQEGYNPPPKEPRPSPPPPPPKTPTSRTASRLTEIRK